VAERAGSQASRSARRASRHEQRPSEQTARRGRRSRPADAGVRTDVQTLATPFEKADQFPDIGIDLF
jgi:hypothetical protein